MQRVAVKNADGKTWVRDAQWRKGQEKKEKYAIVSKTSPLIGVIQKESFWI